MSSLLAYLRGNSIPFMRGPGGDGDNNKTDGNGEGMGRIVTTKTKTCCAGRQWGQKSVPVSLSTTDPIMLPQTTSLSLSFVIGTTS